MIKEAYLQLWEKEGIPEFLKKYKCVPSLLRLQKIGYFCGMDYASKDVYSFLEMISRYDHSLSTAYMTWYFTKDPVATIAALFHDISTPCFSHVIDYMNKDYSKQESTEEKTEEILARDAYLLECLKQDNISLNLISNFKQYSIVDLERPKLCADRLDGIFLTGLFWTKTITLQEIQKLFSTLRVYKNEDGEKEIGFSDFESLQIVLTTNSCIDSYCHSNEDHYMMELLAEITKEGIEKGYYTYEDLYILNEEQIFSLLMNTKDSFLLKKIKLFQTIKKEDIPKMEMPFVKKRCISPILNGKRI